MTSTSINNKSVSTTIAFKDWNQTLLNPTGLTDNKFGHDKKYSPLLYNNTRPGELQLPLCKIFTGGIPVRPPETNQKAILKFESWFKTDDSRYFIDIPENTNDPKSVNMFNEFSALDARMRSDEYKNQLFGNATVSKKYELKPIVREPKDTDDDDNDLDENKTKKEKPRKIKFLIDSDFKTKEILTRVYIKKDGKKERVDIKTIDDIAQYACYNSNVTMLVVPVHVFADTKIQNKNTVRYYGMKWKVLHILCESKQNSNVPYNNTGEFVDDDDDSSDTQNINNINITKNINGTNVKIDLTNTTSLDVIEEDHTVEADEDEDEEVENEEDNEEVEQPKKEVVSVVPTSLSKVPEVKAPAPVPQTIPIVQQKTAPVSQKKVGKK